MQKRDILEKAMGLLEVFMDSPGTTMNLQNINMALTENGHEPLSRSTFFRLIKRMNLIQNSFEIRVSRGAATERGYYLDINFESGNSFSELYKRINTDLYEKMPINRLFSDDDNHYYSLNPMLGKINEAIKYKQTLTLDYYDMTQVRPVKLENITPFYVVVKPNKVWLYYTKNQEPAKCNLFLVANIDVLDGVFDHLELSDFKEKYLDKHGYFKDELKKLKVILPTEEKHIQFHQFLMEQNFQRYYSSWKDKTDGLYYTEFKSLSKDQIKLFKSISNLIKNS